MLISETWIREWVSPKITTTEMANSLTLAGLEVDSVVDAGPALDNNRIVVGRICLVAPHPDANKLQICEVDVGKPKRLSIICGAANARTDLVTAVATNGAKLPELTVGNREIRGVKSFGMLCSGLELGIDDASDGIIEFDQSATLGTGVAEYLDLQDQVIELELTPNRGDCLGIAGVAREVSTLTGSRLKTPTIPKIKAKSKTTLPVKLSAISACPRYVGRAIEKIDMSAKTPDWMIERLRRCGMRSINPIVDVTNYVMHELGQPMHAFDLAKIAGGIEVRMAKKGEKHKLLDGSSVKLDAHNLVIADHEKAIALAGIMGGDNSAISDKTTDIYLEAAFFAPDYMLGKARDFGMHTDASHRFERGVDFDLQLTAMERATALVIEIAGGVAGPVTHAKAQSALPKLPTISFDKSQIARTLGISIAAKKANRIMENLGMQVKPSANGWRVKPPSWRFDIKEQYDLVEEVGRCFGFDQVPARMPQSEQVRGAHLEKALSHRLIRQVLVDLGYQEAINYSFVDPKLHNGLMGGARPIKLANPIADNMSVMRQSLWPGLLESLRTNLNRQEGRVRLFEIGHVFKRAKNSRKSTEQNRIAGLVSGPVLPRQWSIETRHVDFFDLKGDVEHILRLVKDESRFQFVSAEHPALHPSQSAEIMQGNKSVGFIGKLHPVQAKLFDLDANVFLFELNLEYFSDTVLPSFSEISKFPSMQRDLALVVDESISVQQVFDQVEAAAGDLLTNLALFDIYRGGNLEKNQKSLAISLTFQSESSNLTSLEVDSLTDSVIGVLNQNLNAQLRQ